MRIPNFLPEQGVRIVNFGTGGASHRYSLMGAFRTESLSGTPEPQNLGGRR